MSRDQLFQLLSDAEASPLLRRHLRLSQGWEHWLGVARRLGYRIEARDLIEAQRLDQAARFLDGSRLAAIKPLG